MKPLALPRSLRACHRDDFATVLKQELATLDPDVFPLQQGLRHSSHAITDDLTFIVLKQHRDGETLTVKVGIFYRGVIGGCQCADDPTPADSIDEYCEVIVTIDRHSARCTLQPCADT